MASSGPLLDVSPLLHLQQHSSLNTSPTFEPFPRPTYGRLLSPCRLLPPLSLIPYSLLVSRPSGILSPKAPLARSSLSPRHSCHEHQFAASWMQEHLSPHIRRVPLPSHIISPDCFDSCSTRNTTTGYGTRCILTKIHLLASSRFRTSPFSICLALHMHHLLSWAKPNTIRPVNPHLRRKAAV